MAGTLTIDTLKASTGVLATQNGMNGIAKAWVNYNAVAGTVRSSFNVSSVTKNSAGYYTVNFATAMPDTNYSTIVNAGSPNSTSYVTSGIYTPSNSSYGAKTTSAVQVNCYAPSVSNYDPYEVNVAIFA